MALPVHGKARLGDADVEASRARLDLAGRGARDHGRDHVADDHRSLPAGMPIRVEVGAGRRAGWTASGTRAADRAGAGPPAAHGSLPAAAAGRGWSAPTARSRRAAWRRTAARAAAGLPRRNIAPASRAASAGPAVLIGLAFAVGGLLRRDEAFFGHPLQRVVAPARRGLRVDVRALADVALNDPGDERRLLELEVPGGLAEVQPRRRFDAVGAVPEVRGVAVQRQDLALGEALLQLDGDDRFLDLALPAGDAGAGVHAAPHVVGLQEEHPRQLLGDGAGAGALLVHHVLDGGDDDARQAEADVLLEVLVLGRDDRLAEQGRDAVVVHDQPSLLGELADDVAVAGIDAGDRAGRVVVERRDLRQVPREREQDAAHRAEHDRQQEQQEDGRLARDPDDVGGHWGRS